MRTIQYFAAALLAVFLIVRGIIPAFTTISTDFPNYYASARLLVEGKNISRIYDDDWFQQQIYGFGMNQLGKFSPFPPVTALLMTPLVVFDPLNALRIWTIGNIGFLTANIYLLSRVVKKSFLWCSILVLFSGHALANDIKFGQFYLVILTSMIAGYHFWLNHEQSKSGLVLAIGTAVKYFPVVFLPVFVARREWKLINVFIVMIVFVTVLSAWIVGVDVFGQFLSHILGSHLSGNIQNPFSSTFQSWNSLLRRMFITDPVLNPAPIFNSPLVYTICLVLVYVSVAILLAFAFRDSKRNFAQSERIQFALLGIAGLFLLPASATYHFLLLTLPVGVLLSAGNWSKELIALAIIYGMIGFLPYSVFQYFEGKGVLTVLAYPRLILMGALFALSLVFAMRRPAVSQNRIFGIETP